MVPLLRLPLTTTTCGTATPLPWPSDVFTAQNGPASWPAIEYDRTSMNPSPTRDFTRRPWTVAIAGPPGAGKTTLIRSVCGALRQDVSLGVVTHEAAEPVDSKLLVASGVLGADRIRVVGQGRGDEALHRVLDELTVDVKAELLLFERRSDLLAPVAARDLADFTICVVDVAGGEAMVKKGGAGLAESDLVVLNKSDLGPLAGTSLEAVVAEARALRGDRPLVVASLKSGVGVEPICGHLLGAWREAVIRQAQPC